MSGNDQGMVANNIWGHHFTVDKRYNFKESRLLGAGAFGIVVTAHDSVRDRKIAIKRVRPYASELWDAKHGLREIRLLRTMGDHPNVISLYDLSVNDEKGGGELYFMVEAMDCDLHKLITRSKQPLQNRHFKCFMKQLFEGLKFLHDNGVLHRDLKPGNLLVSRDCQLRITDFGLARYGISEYENSAARTQYVVTRWYRSPELLIAPKHNYGKYIDLWSCGCILAELLRKKPLFPGRSHTEEVYLILSMFGFENPSELGIEVNEDNTKFLMKRCRCQPKDFDALFSPTVDPEAMVLLRSLLSINPNKRCTVEQALNFKYMTQDVEVLYDYDVEYKSQETAQGMEELFAFEHGSADVHELKSMILQDVDKSSASAYRLQPDYSLRDPTVSPTLVDSHAVDYSSDASRTSSEGSQDQLQSDGNGNLKSSSVSITSNTATPVVNEVIAQRGMSEGSSIVSTDGGSSVDGDGEKKKRQRRTKKKGNNPFITSPTDKSSGDRIRSMSIDEDPVDGKHPTVIEHEALVGTLLKERDDAPLEETKLSALQRAESERRVMEMEIDVSARSVDIGMSGTVSGLSVNANEYESRKHDHSNEGGGGCCIIS